MKQFEFWLRISADQYQHYYSGKIRQVVATCTTGATVQFPASLLSKYVTATGVHGHFILRCEDSLKGSTLQKIES